VESVNAWVTIFKGHEHGCCSKIAEAEAAVSVNDKKWLVMHMHVQLKLDELGCLHASAPVIGCAYLLPSTSRTCIDVVL
jgi:hypothetical protein